MENGGDTSAVMIEYDGDWIVVRVQLFSKEYLIMTFMTSADAAWHRFFSVRPLLCLVFVTTKVGAPGHPYYEVSP